MQTLIYISLSWDCLSLPQDSWEEHTTSLSLHHTAKKRLENAASFSSTTQLRTHCLANNSVLEAHKLGIPPYSWHTNDKGICLPPIYITSQTPYHVVVSRCLPYLECYYTYQHPQNLCFPETDTILNQRVHNSQYVDLYSFSLMSIVTTPHCHNATNRARRHHSNNIVHDWVYYMNLELIYLCWIWT